MDSLGPKVRTFLGKYKYVLLVLLVGLGLMLLPEGNQETEAESLAETQAEQKDLSRELEEILGTIRGVGEVRVLLTTAAGESVEYQTDQSSSGVDTVVITDSAKNQQGLVVQVTPPQYLGAIIVCQGGDDPAVKLAVVEAVSNATGLGADKITVLKMK